MLRTDDEDGGVDEVDVLEKGLAGRVRVLQLRGQENTGLKQLPLLCFNEEDEW
jgi:hypothetical protein